MTLDTTEASTEEIDTPLVVTDAALETVMGIRSEEADGEQLLLRIEIVGSRGSEYVYDLSFATSEEVAEGFFVYEVSGLGIALAESSLDNLRGAELDLPRAAGQGGLVIRNPNRPNPLEGLDIELTGDLAEKVQTLLDHQINPQLDSHGGFAALAGVDEDNNVYVTMGGGCHGCSASAMTLSEGIRTTIMTAIPEVNDVIDTTDHSVGENPFYSD